MQVEMFLARSAQRFPDKVALVCDGRRLTYRELDDASDRLAHGLRELGVRRTDRVAIFLENSVEAVLTIFATLKAGAVFVVVNPTTKAQKLAYFLNDCRARVLVSHEGKREVLADALSDAPDLAALVLAGTEDPASGEWDRHVASFNALLERRYAGGGPPPNESIDLDLAALIYTSGSTGIPKGVMLTHLNIVSAATSITQYLDNTPDDIILNVLPLSFDYGLYQVLMAFLVGGRIVLERSFVYPRVVVQRIAEERVTGLPILPTILAILLQMDLTKCDFSSVRYLTNTGAALPTTQIAQLRRLFPQVKIFSMYGLTECKRVSYLPPDQIDIRPTSVGRAMPNVEVAIVDEAGNPLGPGVVGELVVRGANVMRGYWERPQESDEVLRPGPLPGEKVLYSGDLFRMDEEGYLYFVGRRDDIIKSRGEKVSPREIENVLYQLAGVAEAAVVGVADEVLGQAVKAFISLKDGASLTERAVLEFCAERLENLMVPKHVEFRPQLPKTASGKIDKQRLH